VTPTDAMLCTACGNRERASEGYPCSGCGGFICVVCNLRGVLYCKTCTAKGLAKDQPKT
jgi:hypothetical protein